jgi:uncharacterized membrane protein
MSLGNFDDAIFSATLRPHRSLGRRGLVLLIGGIAALSFLIGVYFWWLGAWPVIGFLGLDVLAVALAFKLNERAARAFEEVEVSRAAIVIRKVRPDGRAQEIRFNPQWVRLEVEEVEEEGVVRIVLRARDQRVPVGASLNPEDRKSFARAFRAGLATARGSHGAP